MKKCIFGLLMLVFCAGAMGDPVAALHGKEEAIGGISGFHSAFNKDKSLEIRVLEESGAGSVARNPVYLYGII